MPTLNVVLHFSSAVVKSRVKIVNSRAGSIGCCGFTQLFLATSTAVPKINPPLPATSLPIRHTISGPNTTYEADTALFNIRTNNSITEKCQHCKPTKNVGSFSKNTRQTLHIS